MRRRPAAFLPVLLLVAGIVLPGLAFAEDATLEATLTYVGPGPVASSDVYRYDYTLTNNSVLPAIIELLVFFDSDPDSGVIFLGDNTDYDNTAGFSGSVASPAGWIADVFEDPDPNPWVVDFFGGGTPIAPGASLSGFSVTFLWKGEGTPGTQFFEALDGFAHEGSTIVTEVNFQPVTGNIASDCDGAPLAGVAVDLYTSGGELLYSTFTDADGNYEFQNVPPGDYTVSISTPIGYQEPGDKTVVAGTPVDFDLVCLAVANDPRTIGFWKHQVNAHLTGRGKAQVPLVDFLAALDDIYLHFTQSAIHPVEVYTIDPSAPDEDKLGAAQDILTVNKSGTMNLRARQQLMALLLNVVTLRIGQNDVISADGATVSQAVTYAWDLIADGDPGNDETAKDIADLINNSKTVPAGVIPPSTPNYAYDEPSTDIVAVGRTALLGAFPNPVGAAGTDIRFRIGDAGDVRLEVFDVQGRRVRTLLDGFAGSGEAVVHWDGTGDAGRSLARGLYFYRLTEKSGVQIRKLMLTR